MRVTISLLVCLAMTRTGMAVELFDVERLTDNDLNEVNSLVSGPDVVWRHGSTFMHHDLNTGITRQFDSRGGMLVEVSDGNAVSTTMYLHELDSKTNSLLPNGSRPRIDGSDVVWDKGREIWHLDLDTGNSRRIGPT